MGGISQAEHVEYEKEPKSASKKPTEEEKKKKARKENSESEIPSCSSICLFKYKLTH